MLKVQCVQGADNTNGSENVSRQNKHNSYSWLKINHAVNVMQFQIYGASDDKNYKQNNVKQQQRRKMLL